MSNALKIALLPKDVLRIKQKIRANRIAIIVLVVLGALSMLFTWNMYSVSQVVLPKIVNTAIVLVVVLPCIVFIRIILRAKRTIANGFKYKERITVVKTDKKESHSYNAATKTDRKITTCFLTDSDGRVFSITLRQYFLACEIKELFVEYLPFSATVIDNMYTLDENKQIQDLQWNGSTNQNEFNEQLKKIRTSSGSKRDSNTNQPTGVE